MEIMLLNPGELLYQQACKLRFEIFFQPLDLPPTLVQDDVEARSQHIALVDADTLVAYGRLTAYENKVYQISQLVVAANKQGQGYGRTLLRALIHMAQEAGAKEIVLSANLEREGFYTKSGFMRASEIFPSKKTAIPHIRMIFSGKTP